MEPLPEEAPPGAYGGSRLTDGFEPPAAHAFAGRGELASSDFLEVLREWRVERYQLPHPVNFFQNMRYPDGRVEFGESLAKAGDVVELRALTNLVAAVSACPMDLNPISGYKTRDLAIEVV